MSEYSSVDEPLSEDLAVVTPIRGAQVTSLHGPGPKDLQQVGTMYRNPQTGLMWEWNGRRWVLALP